MTAPITCAGKAVKRGNYFIDIMRRKRQNRYQMQDIQLEDSDADNSNTKPSGPLIVRTPAHIGIMQAMHISYSTDSADNNKYTVAFYFV